MTVIIVRGRVDASDDITKCDCEREGCHVGDCDTRPSYRCEAFGIRHNLCAQCLTLAQRGENRKAE